jgi:hypothetical protein
MPVLGRRWATLERPLSPALFHFAHFFKSERVFQENSTRGGILHISGCAWRPRRSISIGGFISPTTKVIQITAPTTIANASITADYSPITDSTRISHEVRKVPIGGGSAPLAGGSLKQARASLSKPISRFWNCRSIPRHGEDGARSFDTAQGMCSEWDQGYRCLGGECARNKDGLVEWPA